MEHFLASPPDAYERLICDCIAGDSTLLQGRMRSFIPGNFSLLFLTTGRTQFLKIFLIMKLAPGAPKLQMKCSHGMGENGA